MTDSYLESLEMQMSEMRTLLNKYRQLYPDAELSDDLNRIVSGTSPFAESSSATNSPQPPASTPTFAQVAPAMMSPFSPATTIESFDPSDDENTARKNIVQAFDTMSLYSAHDHYLGKSSSMMFLQAALESKQEYVTGAAETNSQPVPESANEMEKDGGDANVSATAPPLGKTKRLEYWQENSVCPTVIL